MLVVLSVPSVAVVVATASWVSMFPPSLLAVLVVLPPVVVPPLWLVVLMSSVAAGGEADLVMDSRSLVAAMVAGGAVG